MADEPKYWLTDLETGWPYQVTRQMYEDFYYRRDAMQKFLAVKCGNIKTGHIQIFSTPADTESVSSDEMRKLWQENNSKND